MIRFFCHFPTFFLLVLLGSACASYTQETRAIRDDFRSENYKAALERLNSSELKEQSRNRLLFLLEKASILDRMGKRKESRKTLMQADDTVDALFKSSLTGDALSFLYNDTAADYQGEDYEKVAIHTLMALSFLQDKEISSATVEARRINTRLNEINNFYEDHKNRYGEDAFARYLSGMIFESQGEFDSAIIDYNKALKLYETTYSEYFETSVPDELAISLHELLLRRNRDDEARRLKAKYPKLLAKRPAKDDAEVVIIHEVDSIAYKVAEDVVLPIGGQVVRISWPTIYPRRWRDFGKTGARVASKGFVSGDMAQNLEAIAKITLEDRRTRLVLKAGARLLVKGQVVQQAEKNFGPLGWIAATVYNTVTETADTRSWTLLPGSYYVTRLRLPPGKHNIEIETNGKISKIKTIELKPRQFVFLRDAA